MLRGSSRVSLPPHSKLRAPSLQPRRPIKVAEHQGMSSAQIDGYAAIGSPELELEMATATRLNCQQDRLGEHTTLGKLAEREELGSNLLRVAPSSLGDPVGLGSFGKGAGALTVPRSDRRWLYRPHSLPRPAANQSVDPRKRTANVRHRRHARRARFGFQPIDRARLGA